MTESNERLAAMVELIAQGLDDAGQREVLREAASRLPRAPRIGDDLLERYSSVGA